MRVLVRRIRSPSMDNCCAKQASLNPQEGVMYADWCPLKWFICLRAGSICFFLSSIMNVKYAVFVFSTDADDYYYNLRITDFYDWQNCQFLLGICINIVSSTTRLCYIESLSSTCTVIEIK